MFENERAALVKAVDYVREAKKQERLPDEAAVEAFICYGQDVWARDPYLGAYLLDTYFAEFDERETKALGKSLLWGMLRKLKRQIPGFSALLAELRKMTGNEDNFYDAKKAAEFKAKLRGIHSQFWFEQEPR